MHYLDRGIWLFLSGYSHYKAGHLPEGGGVLDQSATFLQATEILGGAIARLTDGGKKDS